MTDVKDEKGHALVLEPGGPKPDLEIGQVLATHLKLYLGDAVSLARYGGGILHRRMEGETLRSVADQLRKIGVRSKVIPRSTLEGLPRGYRSTRLELIDDTVWVRLSNRRELSIAKEDIRAVQVHAVVEEGKGAERGKKAMDGDLKNAPVAERAAGDLSSDLALTALGAGTTEISARGKKILEWLQEVESGCPRLFFTVYARDPIGPLRFEHRSTDYSPLGDEKRSHSLDNFLIFIETVLSEFPNLLNRDRVQAFLDQLSPSEILYFKPEEMHNFDHWIQAWIRLLDDPRPSNAADPDEEQESRARPKRSNESDP